MNDDEKELEKLRQGLLIPNPYVPVEQQTQNETPIENPSGTQVIDKNNGGQSTKDPILDGLLKQQQEDQRQLDEAYKTRQNNPFAVSEGQSNSEYIKSLSDFMERNRPIDKEEQARRERAAHAISGVSALGNALSAWGNLIGTAHGAANQKLPTEGADASKPVANLRAEQIALAQKYIDGAGKRAAHIRQQSMDRLADQDKNIAILQANRDNTNKQVANRYAELARQREAKRKEDVDAFNREKTIKQIELQIERNELLKRKANGQGSGSGKKEQSYYLDVDGSEVAVPKSMFTPIDAADLLYEMMDDPVFKSMLNLEKDASESDIEINKKEWIENNKPKAEDVIYLYGRLRGRLQKTPDAIRRVIRRAGGSSGGTSGGNGGRTTSTNSNKGSGYDREKGKGY